MSAPDGTDARIEALYRARPRSRLLRLSVFALLALAVFSWVGGDFDIGVFFSERGVRNFDRFTGELRPHPLQGRDWDWGAFTGWLGEKLRGRGVDSVLATLAISIAAILLAGLFAALLAMPAARNLATPEPLLPAPAPPKRLRRWAWRGVVAATRFVLIFLRAIPEYVWAFIFLGLLGPGAWPAVLALAIHNAGILGKLGAEVVENLEPAPLRAMRGLGATRAQIGLAAVFPASLGRFLLYFFYRWETCVREATVLGLLGVVSIGYWILDARARMHYDEMLLFVLLGAVIILVGDFVSALARGVIRRAR